MKFLMNWVASTAAFSFCAFLLFVFAHALMIIWSWVGVIGVGLLCAFLGLIFIEETTR